MRMPSRFQQEISGMLGEFWVKHAREECERLKREADKDAIIESDGAIRWKTGAYLPDDCCEKLEYIGFEFNREATAVKREKQSAKWIEEYRESMKNHVYTAEELGEMRNAFGAGAKVVNVLTGKVITV